MGLPQLIAHRGYAYRYPENTLEALGAAMRVGARYVEFDVQISSDGVPVVFHDADLNRTTGATGCVHEWTIEALRELSAHEPQRLGDRFVGAKIPTLDEACCLIEAQDGVTGFVEIKEESITAFGPDRVVDAVLEVITRRETDPRFVLISFDLGALRLARARGWDRIGWVLHRWDESSRLAAYDARPEYLFCNVRKVPDERTPFWPGPWEWAVYEITDPDAAAQWGDRGAGLVESFRVGELLSDPRWSAVGGSDGPV